MGEARSGAGTNHGEQPDEVELDVGRVGEVVGEVFCGGEGDVLKEGVGRGEEPRAGERGSGHGAWRSGRGDMRAARGGRGGFLSC